MNYLITFAVESADIRSSLISAIQNLGEWGELTPTSFLLEADLDVQPLIELLQPLIGPSDSLWIFSVVAPWAGYGDPIVEDHAVDLLGEFQDWVPKDWNDNQGSRP